MINVSKFSYEPTEHEAEKASKEVLSIPVEPLMTEQQENYVISEIKEFFRLNG